MCWSAEASTVWAAVGLTASAYAVYKKEDKALYLPLMYFSLMEVLQAYTYQYIDQCGAPENQIATLLGYLHIAFQPFFINMMAIYFLPKEVQHKVEIPVYTLCFASTIFMLVQLYPFDWAGGCMEGVRSLCGPQLCSVSGNWHIAWEVPTNDIGNFFARQDFRPFKSGFVSYVLVAFLLPLLYGSWRLTVYHYFMGPMLANLLTDNVNERPAVWCLLSIGFLLIVVKTPVRKYLFIKKHILLTNQPEGKRKTK